MGLVTIEQFSFCLRVGRERVNLRRKGGRKGWGREDNPLHEGLLFNKRTKTFQFEELKNELKEGFGGLSFPPCYFFPLFPSQFPITNP